MPRTNAFQMNKEKLVFALALCGLLGCVAYTIYSLPPELAPGAPLTRTAELPELNLRPLSSTELRFNDDRASPFMIPGTGPEPIDVRQDKIVSPPAGIPAPPSQDRLKKPEPRSELAAAGPPVSLRFVGVVKAAGQRRALFQREGDRRALVLAPDQTLPGRDLRVLAIGAQSIQVGGVGCPSMELQAGETLTVSSQVQAQ
ncbi:MAG: hypothetical protein L6R28_11670 [Planctomycetes bacterium]|nr:hypothetical protein [Planctomycetota bacterium]